MNLTADRVRQFRGLLLHYGQLQERFAQSPWMESHFQSGRVLIPSFSPGRIGSRSLVPVGICRWCQRATGDNTIWHKPCLTAYFLAQGLTVGFGQYLLERHACPCGAEEYLELDHRVSLVLAKARGDRRGLLRAYTVGNLQWLCHDCHRIKTAEDRRKINNVRAGRPEDWTPPPKAPRERPPPAGAPLL